MASLANIQPSEKAWDHHREELERLYVGKNKSVQYIKRYMEKKYHFAASKYQFDKHFNKWNCSKYGSSLVWKAILPHVRKLEQEGKGAAVFIDMKQKTPKEIRNAMARYKRFLSDPGSADVAALPANARVQPLVQPITIMIPQRLPFYFMEAQLAPNLPLSPAGHHSIVATAAFKEVPCNSPLERILSTAVPPDQHEPVTFNLPIMSFVPRLFASPLHRALVYSITNNLVGFEKIPHQEILSFLKQETTYELFIALSNTPDLYSVQALIQSIFWLAINAGDAEAVTFILKHSLGMDVNGDLPGRMGKFRHCVTLKKPIEIASALGHIEVVKALIAAGAVVDGTRAFDMFLSFAWNCVPKEKYPELLRLLMKPSSDLSTHELLTIVQQSDSDIVQELIMKDIGNNHDKYSKKDVLVATFENQPVHTCHAALETLREYGVDLNAPLYHGSIPTFIVDLLTSNFEGETLCHLLGDFPELLLTRASVCRLVSDSGDTAVVRYALINGPNEYANHKYRDKLISLATAEDLTRFTSAYRIHNKFTSAPLREFNLSLSRGTTTRIIPSVPQRISKGMMVLEFLSSRPTGDIQDLRESLVVASLVGDVERIKEVLTDALTTYGKRCSELLEGYKWLIYRTLQAGHPEAALCLVEAGVIIHYGGGCLKEALRIKHATLFRALLDATGVPVEFSPPDGESDDEYNSDDDGYGSEYDNEYAGEYDGYFIPFVIENGGCELVQVLLECGMGPDVGSPSPLEVALSCKRLEVAKLLLDSGANINRKGRGGRTALQVATKTSDPIIVEFALEQGADPHDPWAIDMAAQRGSCLFNLIISEHKRRYNKGCRDWGVWVLDTCIDTGNLELFKEIVLTHMACVHSSDSTLNDGLSSFGYAVECSSRTGLGFLELLLGNKDKLKCFPNTTVRAKEQWSIKEHRTAFLVAVDTGYLPTINLFLQHGADPGFLPRGVANARTPLQLAAENGSLEVIRLLLDHGASVNDSVAYQGGATALQLATIKGYIPIVQLLMENGADVDAPPAKAHGQTALEGAASNGRLDTVAFLLSAGAAHKGEDKHQLNQAIRYAKEEGHVVVEKLLQDFVRTGELQTSMGGFSDFIDLHTRRCTAAPVSFVSGDLSTSFN